MIHIDSKSRKTLKQLGIAVAVVTLFSVACTLTGCAESDLTPYNYISIMGTTKMDTMYWSDGHLMAEATVENVSGGNEKIYLTVYHELSERDIWEEYQTNKSMLVDYFWKNDEKQHPEFVSPETEFEITNIAQSE